MSNIIEVDANWKKFLEAENDDQILLLHATSKEQAEKITSEGFQITESNWLDSEKGFIYLAGSRYNLGTYLRHTENAIIRVVVKKEDLLPDSESVDWKEYAKQNKAELKREKVSIKNPSAFDTFKHIGQVKAKIQDIEILDFYTL